MSGDWCCAYNRISSILGARDITLDKITDGTEVKWVRLAVVRLLWVDQGRIRVPGFFGYIVSMVSISYSNGYPVGMDIKGSGNRCERSRG